jgi:multidrug efflux pump subunit AcrA (membrane-fusion protein)
MKNSVFIVLIVFLASCGKERESTKPSHEELVEAVYSSVIIEPIDAYKVNSSITGYIDQVYFNEGDFIKKGDLLFLISNKPVALNEQNAELNYALLKDTYEGTANLIEEMKLDQKSSKMKMMNDSVNYQRFKMLFDKNACSKFELDNASMAYELSKNTFLSVSKRIVRKEKELKNQISQSKNNLNASSLRTNDYLIRSNIDGKLFQTFKEKGEFVSMQEPIAIVGDAKYYKLKMLIDEVDISKVTIGQKVLVTLEAYKTKVFEAKITKIAPKMDAQTQTFEIEAVFVKQPSRLYMGLTGEGNIVINEKKKALVIPREYLLPGNKVETDNGMIKVKTGLSNWSFIEIVSGLDENTIILKPE